MKSFKDNYVRIRQLFENITYSNLIYKTVSKLKLRNYRIKFKNKVKKMKCLIKSNKLLVKILRIYKNNNKLSFQKMSHLKFK